ncbi:hypothetical protein GcM3_203046 [Golovinomyces cichoracearum]|uniref:Uncharacterized protein n=1 Tax=Golovinomyces cichoracearum TaxID=62708 RepID=A0A420HCM5_9PEZI|nr:hypothetical protein GcM3_203046 [Golovinomyces cichoracearum]
MEVYISQPTRLDIGYKTCQFRDNTLWEQFREDFEGWKKETFEKADSKALRLLREHLRTNGVWTAKKQGVSMAGSLAQIVEDEKEHQWTVEEIESQLNEGSFNSKHGQPISSRGTNF